MAKRKRPINGVQRRIVWRLYPDAHQHEQLREQAMMCADLWNALLEMIETRQSRAVARYGKGRVYHCAACAAASAAAGKERLCPDHRLPSEFDLGNWISAPGHRAPVPEGHLLRDCSDWGALSTWTPRRVAANLAAAFAAFFRRVKTGENPGYPRYKSRLRHWSVPYRSESGCRIWRSNAAFKTDRHRDNWSVALKGIDGLIRAKREFDGEINEWMDVDIIYRDGHWEASAAVAIMPWRRGGNADVTVRFDLIDGLALVNGVMETPAELWDVQAMQERYDEQRSEHDLRFPRGALRTPVAEDERQESATRLTRLSARIARKRKNALHVWSAGVVRRAGALTILTPAIKEASASVRGQKRVYGAYAVEAATEINRVGLGYAPAMAVAMLIYKAREAGIAVEIRLDSDAPFLERQRLLATGERERARRRADSARAQKLRHSNGIGMTEHAIGATGAAAFDRSRN